MVGYQKQCDLLCSVASGGMLRREKLEELYMYLKSNVLSGMTSLILKERFADMSSVIIAIFIQVMIWRTCRLPFMKK